ncbi:MAG: hypothetical protein JXA42_04645 [Anaerolineales bacterium]|nr:hypothetical protein [Anaerolineales bacterium]
MLRNNPSSHIEWIRLVGILTIGETYFFRNKGHFEALTNHILPEIISRRESRNRHIRIWSAGCATGEEPYSLGMLLSEMLPQLDSWKILILATDINREALRRAKQGIYGSWSFRNVEQRFKDRYFHFNGKQYTIVDEIKQMVTFDYLNLIEDSFPSLSNNTSGMDLIICRNVTIYFSQETTELVLKKFFKCLVDDGWFIPGASEPNMISYKDFEHRGFPGAVVYQKPAAKTWFNQTSRLETFSSKPTPKSAPTPKPLSNPIQAIKPVLVSKDKQSDHDAFETAKSFLDSGNNDQALVKLYEKLEQDPNYLPAYCLLGKIYANTGNLEKAHYWLEQAIAKDKLQTKPYFTLSMIYQGYGMLEKAVDELKKILFLDPTFVLAHFMLGNIYIQQEKITLAHRSFENTRRLLMGKPAEDPVPEGDGLVVGHLLEMVEKSLNNGKAAV